MKSFPGDFKSNSAATAASTKGGDDEIAGIVDNDPGLMCLVAAAVVVRMVSWT